MRTRTIHIISHDTVFSLKQHKKGSLRQLAAELGFPASYAATLSDILAGKPSSLTLDGENALRRALGLAPIIQRLAIACPSCDQVHGSGIDCHHRSIIVVARPQAPDWIKTAAQHLECCAANAAGAAMPNLAHWTEYVSARAARIKARGGICL